MNRLQDFFLRKLCLINNYTEHKKAITNRYTVKERSQLYSIDHKTIQYRFTDYQRRKRKRNKKEKELTLKEIVVTFPFSSNSGE